jgi:hypothetical protein
VGIGASVEMVQFAVDSTVVDNKGNIVVLGWNGNSADEFVPQAVGHCSRALYLDIDNHTLVNRSPQDGAANVVVWSAHGSHPLAHGAEEISRAPEDVLCQSSGTL